MKLKSRAVIQAGVISILCLVIMASCRQDMHDQPRVEPFEESDFFGDRRSARPALEGTIPRGQLRLDEHLYTGKINGELATTVPFPVTLDVLRRGQERYDNY